MSSTSSNYLGAGTYGTVFVEHGKAVKKFAKLSHIIQEYAALRYLNECKHIVHTSGVDFNKLELKMQLYNNSLKMWLLENLEVKYQDVMVILYGIISGLVELHDRDLAHGDLKPGNVLVRNKPLKAVLGDCGFVSNLRYAKINRTADVYRDPIIQHDDKHDMYGFGICMLEILGGVKLKKQACYQGLSEIIDKRIKDSKINNLLHKLLSEKRDLRPTARETLKFLFNKNPPKWIKIKYGRCKNSIENDHHLMKQMKNISDKFQIKRSKLGYSALICFLEENKISEHMYDVYLKVTLMILSALFGEKRYEECDVVENNLINYETIYDVLDSLLSNDKFIGILLSSKRI